ncbi:hypothetical protein ES319_D01G033200v1 [Gossypium barbadense]|uniref:Uncharacterized protein n=2 Tax=Gossypium TaxID=3633 RepID=A0A5J5SJP0_GOSBA|nr:hypothetical protein ES319_D01G033200v1 [Gossypium barbadense]TYG81871.1 hypothetical protein ES288_D01G040200v1 [Gossypium darwinii]
MQNQQSETNLEGINLPTRKSAEARRNRRETGKQMGGYNRDGSSAAEWTHEEEFPHWLDQQPIETESITDGKRWSSQPLANLDAKHLYRTSSYPEQQQQLQQQQQQYHQHFSSEPILVPKSSYISYPPPDGRSPQASPNQHSGHLNIPYMAGGPQMASSPNLSGFPNSQLQLPGLHHGPNYRGNMPQFAPGPSVSSQPSNQWGSRPKVYGDNSSVLNNMLQQQLTHQNGLIPPQLMPQLQSHQQRLQHPVQPSFSHFSGIQSQQFNPHLSPSPPVMNKVEAILGIGDLRDQRAKSAQKGRQSLRGFDSGALKSDFGWPQFTSKYMDLPPGARANTEPHAFLQVDALGRLPFSSIRRPRPVLQVDPPNGLVCGLFRV